ncbi:MAG: CRISPR-associated endonuclease Cas2 [Chloracidobacterium sp.]|uniref:CRISPR-associated endoribonuclease Cas2 n=1 Tax=Chloracidobacterium validum TaxID=2821543 RepID=A0ABX8BFU7_9BACT|nr:CRISPR-associated endonuclease Cas2 [Chloracidobacterium validum]QUW04498.1 CRISPR-associated endonuclease Cas2 [Chloracidobacterium validum]
MRNRYVVCYDIANQKRWRQVYRIMRGFGDAVQYSVFCCDLSPSERMLMIMALTEVMNQREDRVMVVDIGPADGRGKACIEALGKPLAPNSSERITVVV